MEPLKIPGGMPLERLLGLPVVDQRGQRIGALRCLWSDPATDEIKFLGVQTGWLFKRTHLLPAENVALDADANRVRLPYTDLSIKEGPSIPLDAEISEADGDLSHRYYGTGGTFVGRKEACASRWRRITRVSGPGTERPADADAANPRQPVDKPATEPADTANGRVSSQDSEDKLDPLTVGAQVGAMGASLAGAAIGGAVGGPIGVPVGAVLGAVVGGLTGRGIARAAINEPDHRP